MRGKSSGDNGISTRAAVSGAGHDLASRDKTGLNSSPTLPKPSVGFHLGFHLSATSRSWCLVSVGRSKVTTPPQDAPGVVIMSEDDDIDDEEIWNWICQAAAQRAGISAERAKAILEDAGFIAHYHTGIGEAVEVVRWGAEARGQLLQDGRLHTH